MRLTFIVIAFLLFCFLPIAATNLGGSADIWSLRTAIVLQFVFGRAAIAPPSTPGLPLQSNGVRWNVIRCECHRYGGKVPDEYGDIRQARVPQPPHGALI